MRRADPLEKMWGKMRGKREGDGRGRDSWIASPTHWTWMWADSGRQWRTGASGALQSRRSSRVGHDLVTEQWQVHFKMLLMKRQKLLGREAWCATVHGVAKSRTRLSDWTSSLQNALNEAAKTINLNDLDPRAHISFLPRAMSINHFRVHPGMSIVSRKRLHFVSLCHRFCSELNKLLLPGHTILPSKNDWQTRRGSSDWGIH